MSNDAGRGLKQWRTELREYSRIVGLSSSQTARMTFGSVGKMCQKKTGHGFVVDEWKVRIKADIGSTPDFFDRYWRPRHAHGNFSLADTGVIRVTGKNRTRDTKIGSSHEDCIANASRSYEEAPYLGIGMIPEELLVRPVGCIRGGGWVCVARHWGRHINSGHK